MRAQPGSAWRSAGKEIWNDRGDESRRPEDGGVRYDVIAVTLGGSPRTVRLLAHDKDARNAEAIIEMAVARRGVTSEFYTTAPHGKYCDGDVYVVAP